MASILKKGFNNFFICRFSGILIGDMNFADITEEEQDFAALTALRFLMTTLNITSKKTSKKDQWRPSNHVNIASSGKMYVTQRTQNYKSEVV